MTDAIADFTVARIERLKALVLARAREIMKRLAEQTDDDGKLKAGDKDELQVLADVRQACTALLRQAPDQILALADEGLARVLDALRDEVRQQTAVTSSFQGVTATTLRDAVAVALDPVPQAFGVAVDEVRAAVDVGANTPIELDSLIDKVAGRMSVAFSRAAVAVDTAIVSSHRLGVFILAERAAKAFGDVPLFLYGGPDDAKTRPFCEEHVDRVYTAAQIDEMDNDQIDPVRAFGGGFNCRHRWVPVTREAVEREGLIMGDDE